MLISIVHIQYLNLTTMMLILCCVFLPWESFLLFFPSRKLRDVLQQRVIRFLLDQSKKDPEKYSKFFEDYGLFMREGIITTQEQDVKVLH